MSQVKNCPNYTDIINFLADPPDKTDFNGNIDQLGDCTECTDCGVCTLWVSCLFVSDFSSRVGLPALKTIEDLEAYMKKIALDLVMGRVSTQKTNVAVNKPQYTVKDFKNMIPLRAENNNNYIRSNLQKAYDAFYQNDYETSILIFRMIINDYPELEEVNFYVAVSYFLEKDYEKAFQFMTYYGDRKYGVNGNVVSSFLDLCSGSRL